jgi:hypothetical protein
MNKIFILAAMLSVEIALAQTNGKVGINTSTPTETLDVKGTLRVEDLPASGTGKIYNGTNTKGTTFNAKGLVATDNNGNIGKLPAGTQGQVLSQGANNQPVWSEIKHLTGTIAEAFYVQGSAPLNIASGGQADVPGVTQTITVPAGKKQKMLITVTGYVTGTSGNDQNAQGAFNLFLNGAKISSAYTGYVTSVDGTTNVGGQTVAKRGLMLLPFPATIIKSVELNAGTYTFKVGVRSWSGAMRVNNNPGGGLLPYTGALSNDNEAMLTKMQILVYNVD